MRAKSYFSINVDPYRAGIEIAEKLVEIEPEIIFLYPTIHYAGSAELLEAIYDVIDSDKLVIIGNTGDGFYEKNRVDDIGVSALGINSQGAISWEIAYETGIKDDPALATKRCLAKLDEKCGERKPSLYYFSTDFRTDTSKIITTMQDSLYVPIIGGAAAADDFSLKSCFVYSNQEVLTDAIVIVAMVGEFSFDISVAHDLHPCGVCGRVSESGDSSIISIDDKPAMDFVNRETGKPLDMINEGVLTFKVKERDDREEYQLRSMLLPKDGKGNIDLFGGVNAGDSIQISIASPSNIIKDIKEVASLIPALPFKPIAAIIISCAGRKQVLGKKISEEVSTIVKNCPSLEGVVGFPSFGEFGPVKIGDGYSQSLFHNMTYILLLIGEKRS